MKKLSKVISILLVCLLLSSCVISVSAKETNNNSKEEVVYINTDLNGNTENVNVVNAFSKGSVTDYGDYSSVKMLNSTDKITESDNKITFSSNKDRVYYQGTLKSYEIPWDISIKYYLDDKEINPSKLAGKSGKLKIHLKITENKNCKSDFYKDYALQSSFTLDTELCKNIKTDGATVANVGSNKQITYTILPNKGIDTTITADVKKFEMSAVSINGVKMNFNIDFDDKNLFSKVNEIKDASKKINDGASSVNDGTNSAKDGSEDLKNGASSLNDGASDLNTGINSLSIVVNGIYDGIKLLNKNSSKLKSGSKDFYDGLSKINTALSDFEISTKDLKTLIDSSLKIKKAINSLYDGAVKLNNNLGYTQYKSAVKSASKGLLDIDTLLNKNASTIKSLQEQIAALETNVKKIESIEGYEQNPELVANLTTLKTQIESLSGIIQLLQGNTSAINGVDTYLSALSSGSGELVKGLKELNDNYKKFDKAIGSLVTKLSEASVNLTKLSTAINTLVTSYSKIDKGLNNYTDGVAKILYNYEKLVTGTKSLVNGSSKLNEGTINLKSGTETLFNGLTELSVGTNSLLNGTETFKNKTSNIDNTVQDEIDKILEPIQGGNKEVYSFTSSKNTNVISVQFVIKTSEIKKEKVKEEKKTKEEQTFFQKFISLFTDLFN